MIANWLNTRLGDITSITCYKHFILEEYTDDDAVYGLGIDTWRRTQGWQLSQELRSSIKVNDAVSFLVGGFYMKTNYDHFMDLRLQFAAPGLRQLNPQNQDNWSESLFAQSFINLTDKFRFQAGIRFTEEQTKMDAGVFNFINLTGPAVFYGDTPLGGFSASGEKKWNRLGWKLGLDYNLVEDTLLYGYYACGFKSDGFVGRLGTPNDLGPFNPETVDTVELGVKSDLADRRLRVNLATFFTIYKDMQVEENYILPDGKTIGTSIFNAAKSNIKGAELELTALPTSGLTLTGSVAYLDAKYKSFQFFNPGTGGFLDLSSYSLQNAPKVSASAGATYKFKTGPGNTTANVLYTYTASKYLQGLTDGPNVTIQPTHYVHANLSWSPNANKWSIELWARNLLDKHYIEAVTSNPGLFDQAAYSAPREWGVSYKYNW